MSGAFKGVQNVQTLCNADIITNCLVTQFLCPQELIKETREQDNYFSLYLHYLVTVTPMAGFYVFTFTLSHTRSNYIQNWIENRPVIKELLEMKTNSTVTRHYGS